MKILAAITLFIGCCVVSYYAGYSNQKTEAEKHYEVACHMSDALRAYSDYLEFERKDNPDNSTLRECENSYEEIAGINIWDENIKLEDYSWCY